MAAAQAEAGDCMCVSARVHPCHSIWKCWRWKSERGATAWGHVFGCSHTSPCSWVPPAWSGEHRTRFLHRCARSPWQCLGGWAVLIEDLRFLFFRKKILADLKTAVVVQNLFLDFLEKRERL